MVAATFHLGRESVLIAMVFHASNNAVGGSWSSELWDGSDQLHLNLLVAGLWVLVAAAVVTVQVKRRAGATSAARPTGRPGAVS